MNVCFCLVLLLIVGLVFWKEYDRSWKEYQGMFNKLDDQIIDIFDERMKIAEEIGRYKKENNIAILQTRRWDTILNNRLRMGKLRGLGEDFIAKIFRAIHQESINHQNRIMNEDIIEQS